MQNINKDVTGTCKTSWNAVRPFITNKDTIVNENIIMMKDSSTKTQNCLRFLLNQNLDETTVLKIIERHTNHSSFAKVKNSLFDIHILFNFRASITNKYLQANKYSEVSKWS